MILSHTLTIRLMATLEDIGKNFSDFQPQGDDGIVRIVQNWGNELIKQIQNNLRANNSKASGNLMQQIQGDVTTPPTGYNLSIKMLDYYKWIEEGRPPTKTSTKSNPTLQKSIEEWIVNKGIQTRTTKNQSREATVKSLAYVIARKIHQKGTKAKPFLSPALNKVTTEVLAQRISKYIVETLTT